MSLCQCPDRPRCQMQWCSIEASWSVRKPRWGARPAHFMFMCEWHGQMYRKLIPGIDRPAHADDQWCPSLLDMMRLARIAIKFQERDKQGPPQPDPGHLDHYWRNYEIRRGFTPPQLAGFRALRALARKYRSMSPAQSNTEAG